MTIFIGYHGTCFLEGGDFEFCGAEKFDNFVQMVSFTMVL